VAGADIDAPWLFDSESFLRVNGVDVVPLVEAELNHRFPGRADRRAGDPDGLCAAWASLEHTWAATLERVAAMPAGTVEVSVGGDEMSIFTTVTPSYAEVLEVRAGRVAMVRDFLATVTSLELAATRKKPVGPRAPGDHPLVPACDPRGGVGTPPLRRARPRRDRGGVRR